MTNQKGSIRIELVAIILIIVAALVYVVAIRPGAPSPGQNSPPSPLFDKEGKGELEGWKTYRNEEYGFQMTLTEAWKGYDVTIRRNEQ